MNYNKKESFSEFSTLNDDEFWRKIEEQNKEIPNWKLFGFESAKEYADFRQNLLSSIESDNVTNSW